MKNTKLLISAAVIILIFVVAAKYGNNPVAQENEAASVVQDVSVQTASESKSLSQNISYPATIAGDQEIQVTATSTGTVSLANFSINSKVGVGSTLIKIDEIGNLVKTTEFGFQNSQVQQANSSLEQAKKSLSGAEKSYKIIKKDSASSDSQIQAAKNQRDMAKLQVESASMGLKSTLDRHLIISPISGVITQKFVSNGDSISMGQPIASISKTSLVKIQFYVNQSELAVLKNGYPVEFAMENDWKLTAKIKNISPIADSMTKRFLVEAYFDKQNIKTPAAGSVGSISFQITLTPKKGGDIIVPLSSITTGQNENFIFIVKENAVKKISVDIKNVDGEYAELFSSLGDDEKIIINGSKLVQEGATVNITN